MSGRYSRKPQSSGTVCSRRRRAGLFGTRPPSGVFGKHSMQAAEIKMDGNCFRPVRPQGADSGRRPSGASRKPRRASLSRRRVWLRLTPSACGVLWHTKHKLALSRKPQVCGKPQGLEFGAALSLFKAFALFIYPLRRLFRFCFAGPVSGRF